MNSTLRTPLLALTGALVLAQLASAQLQQVCFNDTIPLQPTNWSSSMTVSKFDPNLGTLVSIDFTLSAQSQGDARAESLDASAAQVTLTFQNTVTLTRPDTSVIVVTIPEAQFMHVLSAFDGMIDFGGTSGVSHLGLVANDSDSVTAPPPPSDLALFTGPAGLPGTITLPVAASGSSSASGPGNLTSNFTSAASASLQVCYNYIPNTPPSFTSPQCGTTLMASAGVPFALQVCAGDIDPTDIVTLTATQLPAGATLTPTLPQSGNPVCATINWTPGSNQVGPNTFCFTALDTHNRSTQCCFTVLVAECHLLLGQAPVGGTGNLQVDIFGHLYDTQLSVLRRSWPVTMEDIPTVILPVNARMSAQLLMYNPLAFPLNPSQWSKLLTVQVNPNGTLSRSWAGTQNGITLRATSQVVNGQVHIRFPFGIDGM